MKGVQVYDGDGTEHGIIPPMWWMITRVYPTKPREFLTPNGTWGRRRSDAYLLKRRDAEHIVDGTNAMVTIDRAAAHLIEPADQNGEPPF